MAQELGNEWQKRFSEFDMKPFAAASIGQVVAGFSLHYINAYNLYTGASWCSTRQWQAGGNQSAIPWCRHEYQQRHR